MHKSLYRKYRPQSFFDVVGQEHITATLKNEIVSGKIAHAYLFTGTRGTGKTSCAKIFAKAVNCQHPVNGNPCNECEICRGIASGEIMDIIEIDAASNNGVDDVRELRSDVIYSPSLSNYKVYIIDEVHMLSMPAFNALLKTLEEPPAHVIFILATTEINKVPMTVLSRCQRFDFRRLTINELTERLALICNNEKIEFENEALSLIARLGDGSMRDSISILDQCAGIGRKLDLATVQGMTQSTGKESLFMLCNGIIEKNYSSILSVISDLYYSSKDFTRLTEDIISFFRDVMIIKELGKGDDFFTYSDIEIAKFKEIAKKLSLAQIVDIIDRFQLLLEKMPRTVNKKVAVEVTFLQIIHAGNTVKFEGFTEPIAKGEVQKPVSQLSLQPAAVQPLPSSSASDDIPLTDSPPWEEISQSAVEKMPEKREPANEAPAKVTSKVSGRSNDGYDKWPAVLDYLRSNGSMPLWALLLGSTAVKDEHTVYITSKNAATADALKNPEQLSHVVAAIKAVSGENVMIQTGEKPKKQIDAGNPFDSWLENNSNDIDLK